jgi:hypothetical protein
VICDGSNGAGLTVTAAGADTCPSASCTVTLTVVAAFTLFAARTIVLFDTLDGTGRAVGSLEKAR